MRLNRKQQQRELRLEATQILRAANRRERPPAETTTLTAEEESTKQRPVQHDHLRL